MIVHATDFDDAKVFVPDVHADERGYFKEIFSERRYQDAGVCERFVQDNISCSRKRVLRGMHYDARMAKLVQVLSGAVFDVIVDVRERSATRKRWQGFHLEAGDHHQLYVPPGFAHGFLVLSDEAIVMYKQSAPYDPATERTFHWASRAIGITWPLDGEPILSPKDAAAHDFR